MAKEATLPKAYTFKSKIYGPGDVVIPNDLFDLLVDKGVLESDGSSAESEPGEADEDLFKGLTDEQIDNLENAGYDSEEAVAEASVEDLIEVDQIGKATAEKLKARAG